jgi:uncharacterized membrane protein
LIWKVFLAILALSVGAQLLVAPQPHFAIERLFGFNALYGLLACAALILVAKGIGLFVKRKDNYYRD